MSPDQNAVIAQKRLSPAKDICYDFNRSKLHLKLLIVEETSNMFDQRFLYRHLEVLFTRFSQLVIEKVQLIGLKVSLKLFFTLKSFTRLLWPRSLYYLIVRNISNCLPLEIQ